MYHDHDDGDFFPMGDARRCPCHPHVVTSSADGMFDAPCGECEAAMEDDYVGPATLQERLEVARQIERDVLADDLPF